MPASGKFVDDEVGEGYMPDKERVVRIGRDVWCQLCVQLGTKPPAVAEYDARTVGGQWGYLCRDHFEQFGVGLGVGRGVRIAK
mgnify:FL=1